MTSKSLLAFSPFYLPFFPLLEKVGNLENIGMYFLLNVVAVVSRISIDESCYAYKLGKKE